MPNQLANRLVSGQRVVRLGEISTITASSFPSLGGADLQPASLRNPNVSLVSFFPPFEVWASARSNVRKHPCLGHSAECWWETTAPSLLPEEGWARSPQDLHPQPGLPSP